MKISEDIQAVKDYLEGKPVIQWTYLEDQALGQPDNSNEYRLLLTTKGKDEIEKRKWFLLKSTHQSALNP